MSDVIVGFGIVVVVAVVGVGIVVVVVAVYPGRVKVLSERSLSSSTSPSPSSSTASWQKGFQSQGRFNLLPPPIQKLEMDSFSNFLVKKNKLGPNAKRSF